MELSLENPSVMFFLLLFPLLLSTLIVLYKLIPTFDRHMFNKNMVWLYWWKKADKRKCKTKKEFERSVTIRTTTTTPFFLVNVYFEQKHRLKNRFRRWKRCKLFIVFYLNHLHITDTRVIALQIFLKKKNVTMMFKRRCDQRMCGGINRNAFLLIWLLRNKVKTMFA